MVLNYIEATRKQPEEVRKRKAMLLTIAITGCIAAFYLLTLFLRFDNSRSPEDNALAPAQGTREDAFNTANVFLQEPETQGNTPSRQWQNNFAVPDEQDGAKRPFGQ